MQSVDNGRLAYSFRWGFIADRVVEILTRYTKGQFPSENEKELLEMARKIFHMILKGEEQASSGKFKMNSLDSIKIYNRSLSIFNTEIFLSNISNISNISNSKMSEIISKMDSSIAKIINSETPEVDVEIEILFFDLLRELTLEESEFILDGFYESRGIRKWSSLPKSIS